MTAPRATTIRNPVRSPSGSRIVLTGKRRRQKINGGGDADDEDLDTTERPLTAPGAGQFTEEDRRSSSLSGGRRKLNRIPGGDFSRRKPAVDDLTGTGATGSSASGLRFTGRRRLRPSKNEAPSAPADISGPEYDETGPSGGGAIQLEDDYEEFLPPPAIPNIQPDIKINTV